MASMLSARSKLQRADSIHRGRNVSGLGIVEKGSKSPAGKSSPSTMQPKSKIPTNVSQLPRSGASLVVTEEITKEEVFDMKSVSKNDDAKVQGYISCQSTPMVTPRLRAPAAGSVRRLAARSLSNSKPAIPKPKTSLNRLLENQFNAKKHKYTLLRKELTDKQKNVLDLYEEIVGMREKVIASGFSDPGKPEEISVVQTSRMTPKQPEPVPGEGSGEQSYDLTSSISNEFVSSLKDKLHELPNAGFALCREALRKRSDILLSWLAASGDENNAKVLDPATAKQIEIFQTDGLTLQERLEGAEKLQEQMTVELLQKISALWGEHESYRIHIKEQEVAGGALVKDLRGKLSNVVAELNAEQEKCSQFKERKICLDGQVQKAKLRIRELEAHVTNNDTKIRQLQENVKSLEAQQKQKDASHEQRTKDMQKSMKNSESLLSKMEKQRDCLESRLIDLKETIGSKELESESTVRTMTRKLEEVARSLEDEKKARQQAETELSEIRERFSKLEDKSQQLCDLAEKTKDLPVTDGSHTDEEVRLWQQLQEALSSVHERDEKLVQLQHEKDEIVTLMHQAAGQDIAGSVKGKLAAELIAKTEELQVLMADHLLLQKNNKILREKSDNVEKQLADLHSRLHAQCMEGGKAGWSAHAVELQQQVSDLQTGMAELARRNEELESTLTQKQLELEHRDRLMRDQSKVLKVRDELIDLMKGKDQRMNGNIATLQNDVDEENHDMDQVNKQISAKAEELQALYSTLESKQMQVMRLEKLVKQLEDQHDRAQAKRTRLESHIAELQIQLEERNQGSRGFSFM